jgi:hypothetical protein
VFLPGIALALTGRRPHPGGYVRFHLPKEALKRHTIDKLRRVKAATSARSIATGARRRCPVLLIVRHGQRAELRCVKYLRRLGVSVVLLGMRKIDALSVLSHQVKGAGASSWRDADPDASHLRPLPRSA